MGYRSRLGGWGTQRAAWLGFWRRQANAVLTADDREDALMLARKLEGRLGLVVVGSD